MANDVVKSINELAKQIPENLIISPVKWKYLMRSVLRGKNIMITGRSGFGKTITIQYVAQVFPERQFFTFNFGAMQDARSSLIGNTHFKNETFFSDSLFVKAIQTENAIIFLDELSRAHPDAVNISMTVLDEKQRYLRIDEKPDTPTIKVAKGVCFMSTANIGAEYTAARVMDRALLDRFIWIEMDFPSKENEAKLLHRLYPDVPMKQLENITDIADQTRALVLADNPSISDVISCRMTVEMAGLLNDGFSLSEAAEVCIFPFYGEAGGAGSERTFMRQLVQSKLEDENNPSKAKPFTGPQTNPNSDPANKVPFKKQP